MRTVRRSNKFDANCQAILGVSGKEFLLLCTYFDACLEMNKLILEVRFLKTDGGTEPVRDWPRELSAADRKTIG
jgi:hypothetical protein